MRVWYQNGMSISYSSVDIFNESSLYAITKNFSQMTWTLSSEAGQWRQGASHDTTTFFASSISQMESTYSWS